MKGIKQLLCLTIITCLLSSCSIFKKGCDCPKFSKQPVQQETVEDCQQVYSATSINSYLDIV